MAIVPVNVAQTPSAITASLALPATPAAGNLLVAFIVQTGTATNAPTLTGFAINGTSAFAATTTSRIYVGIKVAAGTETELAPTPGASGTIQGICYGEFSAGSTNVDVIVATNNAPKAKSITSEPVTTTTAGDLIFACYSRGANNNGGAEPWTGTGPMTNVSTASTRAAGGYLVTSESLTAATFTANYTTVESVFGMLVIAIKPSGGTVKAHTMTASQGQTATTAKTLARSKAATQGQEVTATKMLARSKSATQSQAVEVAKMLARSKAATQGQQSSISKMVARSKASTQGQTTAISKAISRSLSVTQTQTATVTHGGGIVSPITLSAVQGQTASIRRTLQRTASATQTQSASFKRILQRSFTVTQPTTITISKALRRIFLVAQGQTASATGASVVTRGPLHAYATVHTPIQGIVSIASPTDIAMDIEVV